MIRHWKAGDAVVLRHARNAYRWAAPMNVVRDDGDRVVLYLQPGSTVARMAADDGSPTRDFYTATRVVERRWVANHVLHITRFGERYSVQLMWAEHTWELRCWYINFQEPLERSPLGFQTMDLTLDLMIAPDLQRWQWKDEDEFARGIELGWYTEQQLQGLRHLGERVLDDAAKRRLPFNEPWPEWRPPVSWSPLSLPVDWDR